MRYYVVNVWLKNGRRLCWNVEPILMLSYPRCFIRGTGKVSCADLNVGKSNIPQQAVGQGKNLRLQKSEIRSRSIAYWTSAFPTNRFHEAGLFYLLSAMRRWISAAAVCANGRILAGRWAYTVPPDHFQLSFVSGSGKFDLPWIWLSLLFCIWRISQGHGWDNL